MKRGLMVLTALLLSVAFVGGSNTLSDTAFTLGFLTNCNTIDTDGSGSFSCGTDADTHLTAFYPYIYVNTSTAGINTSAIQRRVSGTCGVGNSIRVINEDGTVTCEADSTGTDTNESARFNQMVSADCGGTQKMVGIGANGAVVCAKDNNTAAVDTNETPRVEQTLSYRGNLSGTDCAANQKVVGVSATGTVACDADNNTDTNTNADTICAGTSVYLDGEGNCDTLYTDTVRTVEFLSDATGNMTTGNTETNIAVTYQDADNTIDFVVTDAWWNADGDIGADEISEGKINFVTACAAGNHYYLSGNDLACEADDNTQLSEAQVEAMIFDTDNDIDLNMTGYNVTTVDCIRFENGAEICGI